MLINILRGCSIILTLTLGCLNIPADAGRRLQPGPWDDYDRKIEDAPVPRRSLLSPISAPQQSQIEFHLAAVLGSPSQPPQGSPPSLDGARVTDVVRTEVQLDLHGELLIPFGESLRQDLLVAVDIAITVVDLSNIAIDAVEEFLPTSGPGAQQYDPQAGPVPGRLAIRDLFPAQAPGSASWGRRRLLANLTEPGGQPSSQQLPFVRITVVLTCASANLTQLLGEVNSPAFPFGVQQQLVAMGVGITDVRLVRVIQQVGAPQYGVQPTPGPPPPLLVASKQDWHFKHVVEPAIVVVFCALAVAGIGVFFWKFYVRRRRATQLTPNPSGKESSAGKGGESDGEDQVVHQPPPFSVAMAGRADQPPGVQPPHPQPLPSSFDGSSEVQLAARTPAPAVSRRGRVRSVFEVANHQVVSSGPWVEPGRGVIGERRMSGAVSHASFASRMSGDGESDEVASTGITPRRLMGDGSAEASDGGVSSLQRQTSGTPGGFMSSQSLVRTLSGVSNGGGGAKLPDTRLRLAEHHELLFLNVIGRGSFGEVHLGKWQEAPVAIKQLHLDERLGPGSRCGPENRPEVAAQRRLLQEAGVAAALNHPNVVQFMGVCLAPPCLITEYCALGSLLDVITRANACPVTASKLTWERRLNMALDAAKGMVCLHSQRPPVLHRDLKSANLMVNKFWTVKVADFNLARLKDPDGLQHSPPSTMSSSPGLNPRWLAPEIVSGNTYDCPADVYSFAIVLYELLTWRLPWENYNHWQVVGAVVEHNQRPEIPPLEELPGVSKCHKEYVKLMCECWERNPQLRPTFEDIVPRLRLLLNMEKGKQADVGGPLAPTATEP